jgi:hypothetical protein
MGTLYLSAIGLVGLALRASSSWLNPWTDSWTDAPNITSFKGISFQGCARSLLWCAEQGRQRDIAQSCVSAIGPQLPLGAVQAKTLRLIR